MPLFSFKAEPGFTLEPASARPTLAQAARESAVDLGKLGLALAAGVLAYGGYKLVKSIPPPSDPDYYRKHIE